MSDQTKILALALYEIRLLLASYDGNAGQYDTNIKIAQRLAYALHNEAAAAFEGKEFNVEAAIVKIKAIDRTVDVEYSNYFFQNLKLDSIA